MIHKDLQLNGRKFIATLMVAANTGIIPNLQAYPLKGREDFHPGHYIALHAAENIDEVIATNHLEEVTGVSRRYLWKNLEPTNGVYKFSTISRDLRICEGKGKQLIVFLIDKSHGQLVLPPL
ncbi:MAG: hypothetical protein K9M45_07940 [Kiritimatiellales bacterium]|nr:hypothetical protein [Kiritimatiellales bacterium]